MLENVQLEDVPQRTPRLLLEDQCLCCLGDWITLSLSAIEAQLAEMFASISGDVIVDGAQLGAMDTAGAWVLRRLLLVLRQRSYAVKLINFKEEHLRLLQIVSTAASSTEKVVWQQPLNTLQTLGKAIVALYKETWLFLIFVGEIASIFWKQVQKPARLRWSYIANIIQTAGFQALFIVGLLAFLIGIVLAYQIGVQLRSYGANIFVVDLLGLSVFREFGPFLAAIIVAGRTGSAFTAQIGTMKVNQELDALSALGISPIILLVLPRLFGLVVALPLVTVWADLFGIWGGMLMAHSMLGISMTDFLQRFAQEIDTTSFLIGIGKAPVFAAVIASVGCFQGLQVQGSALSVGQRTTTSVVHAIFLIIVVDALFSILFSYLGI